jgi:hypothetical protein
VVVVVVAMEWVVLVVLVVDQLLEIVILQQLLADTTAATVNQVQVPQVLAKLVNHMATEPTAIYHQVATAVITEQIMPGLVYTDLVPGHRLAETAMVLPQAVEQVDLHGAKDNLVAPAD